MHMAEKIRQEIKKGEYGNATNSWDELEEFISSSSNDVDFYNFLRDSGSDPISLAAVEVPRRLSMKIYPTYLSSKASSVSTDISSLMNGVIKDKLKIIPKTVSWGGQAGLVFEALADDFMKPRIHEVDELLSLGISVTIYNGQVDLICASKGTESWVQKLKWEGLKTFNYMDRKPLYCDSQGMAVTKGFLKSYQNFRFYWILGAGHFVSVFCLSFLESKPKPKPESQIILLFVQTQITEPVLEPIDGYPSLIQTEIQKYPNLNSTTYVETNSD
ncbi:serine carboxypeptidase-like, partial [Musa troglodytarum]